MRVGRAEGIPRTPRASVRADGRVLSILGFHKVGEPSTSCRPTWFYVPEATFAASLSYLKENGWSVLDLEAFLRGLARPDSLPERAVLLTFDDGYRSVRDVALPWLLRFGYPAVVFVPTGFIGGCNSFDAEPEPAEAICDWDDLRELERAGLAVQSHGVSHRRFSELTVAEQEVELRRSKAVLEGSLQRPIEVFAYPYGDGGADQRGLLSALQRSGYRAACVYGNGVNRLPVVDPYRLARVAMGPDTDLDAELAQGLKAS